ncbi:MAG TPA: protein-disulfide reductase DsbD domain-containing protein [Planctomycetota bacterium]
MRAALAFAALASLAAAVLSAQDTPPPKPATLTVAGLDAAAPLQVAATLSGLALQVQLTVQDGWHLYGRDTGGGQPVQIDVEPGSAFAAAGALQTPMDEKGQITGKATLALPLQKVSQGSGLRATMKFMVCDALQCLPPMSLALSLPDDAAVGVSILLVAIDESERTSRIAAFLTERGFKTDVTTYAKVQQAECDAHDVVLADSPTYGQLKGKLGEVKRFPETASPIVAVGLMGTELLEHQKVAMACGYI